MNNPTGKLAFSYATIGKLERRIDELMRQNAALAAEVERLTPTISVSCGTFHPLKNIEIWRKGCSCSGGDPYSCEDCTKGLIDAIERWHLAVIGRAVQGEPEETISAVISLVKDAAAAHLNSEFNSCLSKIRKLFYTAPQPAEQQQAEQKPAAWIIRHPRFCGKFTDDKEIAEHWENKEQGCTAPLFLHSQPSPDVSTLVEALEHARRELNACQSVIHYAGGFDPAYVTGAQAALSQIDSALATYRNQGGDV